MMRKFMLLAALGTAAAAPALAQDAGGAPPWPRDAGKVVTWRDYPVDALQRGETGIVSVVLQVSASGTVTACDVTERSGSASLDAITCQLMQARATFDPARDRAGQPVAGVFRSSTVWGIEGKQPSNRMSLALQVERVPDDFRLPLEARLISGADGRIAGCEIIATSGSPSVDNAACLYAREAVKLPVPESASSAVPAAAVRYARVTLVLRPGAAFSTP